MNGLLHWQYRSRTGKGEEKCQSRREKESGQSVIKSVREQKKDKKKPKTVDIICTILKDNKITIILHPNTVLINQVSGDLSFFYGSSSKDDEIPGKGEIGTVFLLKSDFTNIHVRLKNYISDSFIADKPGTSRVVRCKKKKENKYKEFVMQNSLYLIATDLDLYCNIIDFEPKILFS